MRIKQKKHKEIIAPLESAKTAIGTIEKNCRIIGVTKGQFSLLDLISAVANQIGPCHLSVSTWSTGIRDTENLEILINKGIFKSVTLLIDRSFAGRQPKYIAEVLRVWGKKNVRVTRNHAKFCLLKNKGWNICIRSSMNLNRNPRLEQFDIDDNKEIYQLFQGVIDELYHEMPEGFIKETKVCDKKFAKILGGGISDKYAAKDLKSWKDFEKSWKDKEIII